MSGQKEIIISNKYTMYIDSWGDEKLSYIIDYREKIKKYLEEGYLVKDVTINSSGGGKSDVSFFVEIYVLEKNESILKGNL